ncbi:MAG: acyltransferase family protein [Acidimicrobiia bacterium]
MAAHLTGSTPGRRIGYFPALDGIRAFTILAVFAFHGEGSNYLPSGYLSVATFFTLSGFLITSLLTSEYDSAYRIQLRTFWSRRFRRLLPVSWLTLLFVAGPYSWWFATGAQLTKIRGDVVASLFQVVNWRFILDGRAYFEATGRPSPLHHFWTLAIEEQFYILFPLLVVLVYRGRHRRRTLAGVLLVLAIGSAVLGVVVLGGDRAYFGTDTRAAEILIGALLAVWMRTPRALPHRWAQWLAACGGIVGVLGMLWAWRFWPLAKEVQHSGGFFLYHAFSVLAILGSLNPGPIRWLLARRPLVYIGTISYGMYLFHVPVIQMLDRKVLPFDAAPRLGIQLGATILLAAISARVLELPIRRGELLRTRLSRGFVPACSASLIVILAIMTTAVNPTRAQSFETGTTQLATGSRPRPTTVLALGDRSSIPSLKSERNLSVATADTSPCGYARFGALEGESTDPKSSRARANACEEWWSNLAATLKRDRPDIILAAPYERDRRPRTLVRDGPLLSMQDPVLKQWLQAELDTDQQLLASFGSRIVWVSAEPDSDPSAVEYNSVLSTVARSGDVVAAKLNAAAAIRRAAGDTAPRITVEAGTPVDPSAIPGAPDIARIPVSGPVRIAIFGDSVAYGMAYGLQLWNATAEAAILNNWGRFHCPIARGGRIRFEAAEETFEEGCDWAPILPGNVRASDPHVVAIMSGAWDLTDRLLPGDTKWRGPGDPVFDNYFIREMTALVDMLGARGARVVILTHHHVDIGRNLGFRNLPESNPARVDRLNEMYKAVAAGRSGFATVIDLQHWISGLPKGEKSETYLADGLHLRDEMSYAVAQWLGPALVAVANDQPVVIPDPSQQPDPGPLPHE